MCGGVVGLSGGAADAGVGGEVDDPAVVAVAVGSPVDGGELGGGEAALEVGSDEAVPFFFEHVEDHALAQDAVGADEHVESAELVDGGLDHALGAVHVGDVADEGDGLAAGVADFLHDGVDFGGVHSEAALDVEAGVGDDDFGALLAEDSAEVGADAAGATGDDADSAFEVFHGLIAPAHEWRCVVGILGGHGDVP